MSSIILEKFFVDRDFQKDKSMLLSFSDSYDWIEEKIPCTKPNPSSGQLCQSNKNVFLTSINPS
jgi:hypothetical protein